MTASRSLNVSRSMKSFALWTDRVLKSAMLSPPTVTASASRRSLRPRHAGHSCSVMYCSSSARMAGLWVSR